MKNEIEQAKEHFLKNMEDLQMTSLFKHDARLLLAYIDTLEKKLENVEDKLDMICCIGFDYDGYNDVEHLKSLIDELVTYAKQTLINIKEGE